MKIKMGQLKGAVVKVLKADKVPVIKASPGVGKSDIVRSIAKDFNLLLLDERLSQYDPTDLNGFPTMADGRSHYAPPANIPLETDDKPEGYNGWLLFLDEINSAPLAVQAAAYKLILDRAIGDKNLHPDVAIVAAGNLSTDKAIVNRMGTAMQSRLVHLNPEVNHKDWIDWANSSGVDRRVTSFIAFRPELLFKFDPNHKDDTFPCPRTWQFMSDILKENATEEFDEVDLAIAAGTVGEGAAIEFNGFMQINETLPSIKQILDEPEKVRISNDMSVKYALTGLISHEVTEKNIDKLGKFTERLPTEFQLITWRAAIRINPAINSTQYIKEWIKKNAKEL